MKKILALALALCMLCSIAMAETADATYTYNTYMSEFPTVWSPFQQQTATDSELGAYLWDGFYDFDFNENKDGYVIKPAMAAEFPVDVTADYVGEKWGIAEGETARAWKITLRDDLKWQDGTAITAADFVKSTQYLLNPKAANYRADSYYNGTMVLVNAEGYVKQGQTSPVTYASQGATIEGIDAWLAEHGTEKGYINWSYTCGDTWDFENKVWTGSAVDEVVETPLTVAELWAFYTEPGQPLYEYVTWADDAGKKAYALDELQMMYTFPEVAFEDVGFFATADNELVLVLAKPLSGFYLHYSLTSSYLVNIPLYESLIKEEGGVFTNAYGTSKETSFSYGPWILDRYQSDKEIHLIKNPYWYGYNLPENEGLYQATAIHYDCIEEPSTAFEMFFNGQLDAKGLDKDHIADYIDSDYTYLSEGDSVFAMVFNPDMEALKANQAAAGENVNKTIITVKEFRMAMSMAMDRAAFCLATSPMNQPAFALYSGQIVSDPDAGVFYRTTDEAKDVIVNFWALADEIGEGKMYATKDDAIDALSGYNLEMGREYFNKAYDIAIAEGLMDEDDIVTIIVGTPNATSAFYNGGYDFIVNNYTEAVKGTKLEGKIAFTRDSTLGNGFSDALKTNTVDMLFGVGWTGSTFDPYGLMEAYTSTSYQYDPAWDTTTAKLTINLDGNDYTATVWDWTCAINGAAIKADATVTVPGVGTMSGEIELSPELTSHNMQILAALENAVLQNYDFIPLMGDSSAALKGMQIEYGLEDEVFPMGRGGIKYMTFNMTDAEWDAFVAEQGGTLNYK